MIGVREREREKERATASERDTGSREHLHAVQSDALEVDLHVHEREEMRELCKVAALEERARVDTLRPIVDAHGKGGHVERLKKGSGLCIVSDRSSRRGIQRSIDRGIFVLDRRRSTTDRGADRRAREKSAAQGREKREEDMRKRKRYKRT